jgi:hypothetical protein
MDGYLINGSVGMPRGSLLRIDEGAGVLVYVWEGELWLTQEGSLEDHVLQAGQWFRLDCGGATLVHAFRRSVVSLSASAPDAPARRITLQRSDAAAPALLHRSGGSRLRRALRRLLGGGAAPRPAAAG